MPRGRLKDSASDALSAEAAKIGKADGDGGNLGFEAQPFLAADKLRKNLEPSDYKHVAIGLIFLKYISNGFESKRAALLAAATYSPVTSTTLEAAATGCVDWRTTVARSASR
jgi:type I restriction enzyme M protein